MLNCVCASLPESAGLRAGDYRTPTHGPWGTLCEPAPAYKGVSFDK
jgi:hypothetical protein